jgi:hypothetical protein
MNTFGPADGRRPRDASASIAAVGQAGNNMVHDRFCVELMVDAIESIYDEGARVVRPSEVVAAG